MDSLTWDTLPGAAETDSLYMVCMESMTTASGFRLRMTSDISARLVSQSRSILEEKSPILSARILIWAGDSSPDIYSTLCPRADRFRHT